MIATDGYCIESHVIGKAAIASLIDCLSSRLDAEKIRQSTGARFAVRNLLDIPKVRELAYSANLVRHITPVIGNAARPVRAILFDKTPDANWKVAYHQDLSIIVRERHEVAGFGPWSTKAGAVHVQPPVYVLENMLTMRLHLDDCDQSNGPLKVLPGSHRHGLLDSEAIRTWRDQTAETECLCPAGGAVLMKPLLLHASSSATSPRHRRVVHIEYAGLDLPGGLEWLSVPQPEPSAVMGNSIITGRPDS